uniref:Uncharacterized protein n=1 Tax=Anopheles atroparvus TaxID=41427 RepID=A0AAG5DWN0_ANOAO
DAGGRGGDKRKHSVPLGLLGAEKCFPGERSGFSSYDASSRSPTASRRPRVASSSTVVQIGGGKKEVFRKALHSTVSTTGGGGLETGGARGRNGADGTRLSCPPT